MDNTYQSWLWQKLGEKCVDNLKQHRFDAHLVENEERARALVHSLIAGCETFGFGGSATTRKIGLLEQLKAAGKTVWDHLEKGLTPEQSLNARRQQMSCDCFFCSANAISVTGEIVNVDGVGNRVNAMVFGPKKVIIIAGMNKVTEDLHSALRRVRSIAGPMRAKSLGVETPCAETGICNECNSPKRICNVTVILERKPALTDISVILVNRELGF